MCSDMYSIPIIFTLATSLVPEIFTCLYEGEETNINGWLFKHWGCSNNVGVVILGVFLYGMT